MYIQSNTLGKETSETRIGIEHVLERGWLFIRSKLKISNLHLERLLLEQLDHESIWKLIIQFKENRKQK